MRGLNDMHHRRTFWQSACFSTWSYYVYLVAVWGYDSRIERRPLNVPVLSSILPCMKMNWILSESERAWSKWSKSESCLNKSPQFLGLPSIRVYHWTLHSIHPPLHLTIYEVMEWYCAYLIHSNPIYNMLFSICISIVYQVRVFIFRIICPSYRCFCW